MTPTTLRSYTAKDLAQLARQNGVLGWHSMRKEELIRALVRLSHNRTPLNKDGDVPAVQQTNPQVRRKLEQLRRKLQSGKSLAAHDPSAAHPSGRSDRSPSKDRLVVMVRDPYWLHATWELSQLSIDRARAAMGQSWHTAKPVLRLYRVNEAGLSILVRNIAIHGGVSHWYVDVQDPPCDYRTEIGYLASNRSFYCLARSNTVSTPQAGTTDSVDENWADVAENADRIFAMSGGYSPGGTSRELQELMEERLRRPLGSPMTIRFGKGATTLNADFRDMEFAVDAEVIIYGMADRNAHVTLKGEPVQLRSDGTFAVRVNLPDRRQVIPIVASSSDGVEQRTIILAVERNTKMMEKVVRDATR